MKTLPKFEHFIKKAAGFQGKYPFNEWFSGGQVIVLQGGKGKDFTVAVDKMRIILSNAAHKRGFALTSVLVDAKDVPCRLAKDGVDQGKNPKAGEAAGIVFQVEPGTPEQIAKWNELVEKRKVRMREKSAAKKAAKKAAAHSGNGNGHAEAAA
jgi:hypothetical protein